jgi:hypothetical protein
VILKTPVAFDPSNCCITSPNKGDIDIAVLNFLTSMAMEASIRLNFLNASTQEDAGSQQSDNLSR